MQAYTNTYKHIQTYTYRYMQYIQPIFKNMSYKLSASLFAATQKNNTILLPKQFKVKKLQKINNSLKLAYSVIFGIYCIGSI